MAIPCFFNSSRVPTALSVKALEYEDTARSGLADRKVSLDGYFLASTLTES